MILEWHQDHKKLGARCLAQNMSDKKGSSNDTKITNN